jgi:hypothetical protein
MSNDELDMSSCAQVTQWHEICFIDLEGQLVTVQIPSQVMLHTQSDLYTDLGFVTKHFSSARLARTLLILLVMVCSRPAKKQHRLHHTSSQQTLITLTQSQMPFPTRSHPYIG